MIRERAIWPVDVYPVATLEVRERWITSYNATGAVACAGYDSGGLHAASWNAARTACFARLMRAFTAGTVRPCATAISRSVMPSRTDCQ